MSAQPHTHRHARRWPPLETDESLRVYARTEIFYILKKIMDRATVVSVQFNSGKESLLTTITRVSEPSNELFLEPGPDKEINERLLRARDVLLTSHEGQVKIKFTAENIDEAEYLGVRAFRTTLPEFLIRLQRRQFFRIPTSVVNPVFCCFRLDDGQETTAVLVDISVGGVCLIDIHHTLDFKVGATYDSCYIDLPGHGTVDMGLQVRNVADTRKVIDGKVARRAGCRFVNLSRPGESAIQRYIMSLEMARDMRQGRRIMVKR